MALTVEPNTCRCKCINQFPPLPGDPKKLKRGCKDRIHCGRKEQGCGFKRGDAW